MKFCKDCKNRMEHGFCRELKRNIPKKYVLNTKYSIAEGCVGFKPKKKREES